MNAWVLNFANSIVGVGVLAIPFCFHVCGIVIASIMVLATNLLTRKTCEYLLISGQMTRKSGYESLAGHLLGPFGKFITELGIIGLMLGTLISFQVVIGDLAPVLVSNVLGYAETWSLRATLMLISSIGVIPLGLMRNISSLANMNALSMGFYCIFIMMVILISLKSLFSGLWIAHVNFWRPEGIFHCLPIISLAFSCQTQVFVMYEAIPEPSIKSMMNIIDKAINLVTVMYLSVGVFGYIAFYETGIRGDILANFPGGILSDGIKTGFWISIIISFPLIIFPLRMAIHSLLFSHEKKAQHEVISSAADYIPQHRFTAISLFLIGTTLIIGILIPHIETVLSITGAVIGTFLCFVFPAGLYLMSLSRTGTTNTGAKVVFVIGVVCMLASTLAVLSGGHTSEQSEHKAHPGHDQNGQIVGKSVPNPDMKEPKVGLPFQMPGSLLDKEQRKKALGRDGGKDGVEKADVGLTGEQNQQKHVNSETKDADNDGAVKDKLQKQAEESAGKQDVKHNIVKKDEIGVKNDAAQDKAALPVKNGKMATGKIEVAAGGPATDAVKGDVRKLQQVSNESGNEHRIKEKIGEGQPNNKSQNDKISNVEAGQGNVRTEVTDSRNKTDENHTEDLVKSTKTADEIKASNEARDEKHERIDVKLKREIRSIDVVESKQLHDEVNNLELRRHK